METSQHFWRQAGEYIKPGNLVAELYHGEKDDILKGLAEIVKEGGMVYGADHLNPFDKHQNMRDLQSIPNIKLLKTDIPQLPQELKNLDAVVIRELVWAGSLPFGDENPETYAAIDSALKTGGHLILHLNQTEQKSEMSPLISQRIYQNTLKRQLPHFQKVYHCEDLMAYQKTAQDAPK